jgi:hypothetical protein
MRRADSPSSAVVALAVMGMIAAAAVSDRPADGGGPDTDRADPRRDARREPWRPTSHRGVLVPNAHRATRSFLVSAAVNQTATASRSFCPDEDPSNETATMTARIDNINDDGDFTDEGAWRTTTRWPHQRGPPRRLDNRTATGRSPPDDYNGDDSRSGMDDEGITTTTDSAEMRWTPDAYIALRCTLPSGAPISHPRHGLPGRLAARIQVETQLRRRHDRDHRGGVREHRSAVRQAGALTG